MDLSYDKSMKCLRARVPNFEMRTVIGAIVDLNTDNLTCYSMEDCLSGNARMILTFYLDTLEVKEWNDEINFEEIIGKSIEKAAELNEFTLEPLLPVRYYPDKAKVTLKASQNLVTDLLDTYPPFQHTKSGAQMIKFPIGAGKTARTTFIDYIPPTITEP